MNPTLQRLLQGLTPPAPDETIRERVLMPARLALEAPAPPDRWRRLWESRPWRLPWAPPAPPRAAAHGRDPRAAPAPDAIVVRGTTPPGTPGDEVTALLALPRLRPGYADAGATASFSTTFVPPPASDHPPLPHEGPEKRNSS